MSVAPSIPGIVARLRGAGCVFAEDEAELLLSAATGPAELLAMVDRRVAGLPLEQILGWAEFCGLRISVGPGVFVPRRRSEFLARSAAASAGPGAVVVDLCCGSGALGAAVASMVAGIELHAADIDPGEVRCAERNLAPYGGRVHQGDLFAPLPAGLRARIDVLIANTPYVPTGEIALLPPEARDHEPRVALDGGSDGLDVQRRVAAEAWHWLAPGGRLLVEAGERQAAAAAETFARHGLCPRILTDEDLDATVVLAERPPVRR